jgi:hypothetical protein
MYNQKQMEVIMKILTCLLATVLLLAASTTFAQDNSGTNPVNFTYDYRLYTEAQHFKKDAGSQIRNIMEFRMPLGSDMANVLGQEEGFYRDLGSKFQLRFRGYYNHLSLNDTSSAPFGSNTVSGIGDFDARLLYLAHVSTTWGLALGLEAFFNTASPDVLGSGSTNLAPVVFVPLFNILGKGSIFAPGYQYVFNVDGNTVSRSQIDLYFVWALAGGKNWLLLDPQIIIDHHNSAEFMVVDAEWGFMIAPQSGLSGYIRPGIGVGADRPFNYNLEFAVKFVWR